MTEQELFEALAELGDLPQPTHMLVGWKDEAGNLIGREGQLLMPADTVSSELEIVVPNANVTQADNDSGTSHSVAQPDRIRSIGQLS